MYRYILHRLLLLIPTLLGILAITFAVIQFVPGGPVEQMVQQLTHGAVSGETANATAGNIMKNGNRISPEDLAALNALYGFDKPPLTRFADMVWRFARFDLGKSFFHHETVFELDNGKSNRQNPQQRGGLRVIGGGGCNGTCLGYSSIWVFKVV